MYLNIGSGNMGIDQPFAKDPWVNVDINYDETNEGWKNGKYLKFDLIGTWPIEENSVDCIFASHIFEHIEYISLRGMFKECYRVLKAGSPIRIICPDPRVFLSNWRLKNKAFLLNCYGQDYYDRFKYEANPNIAFTDMFFSDHFDHSLISSIDVLAVNLVRAGFSKVNEMNYGNTEFPKYFGSLSFDVFESTGNTLDNRPVMSYYLEAVK